MFNSELFKFAYAKGVACKENSQSLECEFADHMRAKEEQIRGQNGYYQLDEIQREMKDFEMIQQRKTYFDDLEVA